MQVVKINNLRKVYSLGAITVTALNDASLTIDKGDFVSIMGPSGSGKSTMMSILGCLDTPTSGSVEIGGVETAKMSGSELAYIRNKKIGFIFQSFNLLSNVTAVSNVMLPLIYNNEFPKDKRTARAIEMLTTVGLGHRLNHKPNELSGGQKQRVAIARALINEPDIILADEPTGNVDSKSGLEIMALLQDLNNSGITIIIVTHDLNIANHTDKIIYIKDGNIVKTDIVKEKKSASKELAAREQALRGVA